MKQLLFILTNIFFFVAFFLLPLSQLSTSFQEQRRLEIMRVMIIKISILVRVKVKSTK